MNDCSAQPRTTRTCYRRARVETICPPRPPARDRRAAWARPAQGIGGAAKLDELSLPPAGRKRIADVAAAPEPAASELDYRGHKLPGLSKNRW